MLGILSSLIGEQERVILSILADKEWVAWAGFLYLDLYNENFIRFKLVVIRQQADEHLAKFLHGLVWNNKSSDEISNFWFLTCGVLISQW